MAASVFGNVEEEFLYWNRFPQGKVFLKKVADEVHLFS